MSNKHVIVYHLVKKAEEERESVDCPDGICGAWIVHRALKSLKIPDSSIEIVGDAYLHEEVYKSPNYQLPFDPAGKHVIIVDFSYPKTVLCNILRQGVESLGVFDHHESREKDLNIVNPKFIGGYFPNECGSTAAWKYYFGDDDLPWFLPHVKTRDTDPDYWAGKTPRAKAINEYISHGRIGKKGRDAFPFFDKLMGMKESAVHTQGKRLLKKREALREAGE